MCLFKVPFIHLSEFPKRSDTRYEWAGNTPQGGAITFVKESSDEKRQKRQEPVRFDGSKHLEECFLDSSHGLAETRTDGSGIVIPRLQSA